MLRLTKNPMEPLGFWIAALLIHSYILTPMEKSGIISDCEKNITNDILWVLGVFSGAIYAGWLAYKARKPGGAWPELGCVTYITTCISLIIIGAAPIVTKWMV